MEMKLYFNADISSTPYETIMPILNCNTVEEIKSICKNNDWYCRTRQEKNKPLEVFVSSRKF